MAAYDPVLSKIGNATASPTQDEANALTLTGTMPQQPPDYASLIADTEQKYGIPQGLLYRQLVTESGLNPNAYNKSSGATGIAQIEPATAAKPGYGIKPYKGLGNPTTDIDFAGKYLVARAREAGSWTGGVQGYGTIGAKPETLGQEALWHVAQRADSGDPNMPQTAGDTATTNLARAPEGLIQATREELAPFIPMSFAAGGQTESPLVAFLLKYITDNLKRHYTA